MWKHQHNKKAILGVLSILLAIVVYYWVPNENPKAPIMAAIVVIMAMFWIFEIIPIPITSLLPLVLFPVFEILDSKETALFYGKDIIFLFLGGLILAQALQVSNLHKRLALNTVKLIGTNPINMVLGFMVATAFLSLSLIHI
jgi:sodium-dependent dicarboxylate transporter 2/3/5